jgi:predicted alpha-1,2-mannosidase
MRPDNTDYMRLGYVPLRRQFDNSVSHALEYYIADHALGLLAENLGKRDDAAYFKARSLGYKHYYSPEYGTLRPILPDGKFLAPFDPTLGADFEPNPGFHEGSAWNYTFYVPHDVPGLARLMGGQKIFVDKLETVFEKGYYDPANEPDIAYPYLFSYFRGEEWRTQKHTRELLDKYFTASPGGIPGNDDVGTMSAWAVFSMMGLYPDCPGSPFYTLTSPVFDKVTISLDADYQPAGEIVIEARREKPEDIFIGDMTLGGRALREYRISHAELLRGRKLTMNLRSEK